MMINAQKAAYGKMRVSAPANIFSPTTWVLVTARSKDGLQLSAKSPEGMAADVRIKKFRGSRLSAEQALAAMLDSY